MKSLAEYVVKNIGIFDPKEAHGFIIVKPGEDAHTQEIIQMYEDEGWSVAKIRTKTLLEEEAKRLYEPHEKEDWFEPLVKYMCSGPCTGIILNHKGKAANPKDFKDIAKIKDIVREKWSESDMRNVLHSSDSEERFKIEAGIFFWL